MTTRVQGLPLEELFDRVVCVNLDRRPDRWQKFQSRLAKVEWPFAPVKRVRAVDGDRVTSPDWINCGNGAWGCLCSHIRILEDALLDGVTSLLILEDDAIFPEDFTRRTHTFFQHLPDDWDGILLGGQHLVRPRFAAKHVVRVRNGNRTHAHALRERYIQAAYRHLCNYVEHAQSPSQHVDHRLGTLHLRGDYNVYAPNPWIVGQGSGTSDITGRVEDDRDWQDSIRVNPLPKKREDEAIRQKGEAISFVVVTGLYRSGCRAVIGALHRLGTFLGGIRNCYLEEQELRELCCHFFSEPKLQEQISASRRVELLRQWAASRRIAAAKQDIPWIVAKHPLLGLLGADLREAWGTDTKFLLVERDFEEAVASLAKMKWGKFRGHEERAQQTLQEAQTEFFANQQHLLLNYRQLRTHPERELQRIVDYLGLSATNRQRQLAIAFIQPPASEPIVTDR